MKNEKRVFAIPFYIKVIKKNNTSSFAIQQNVSNADIANQPANGFRTSEAAKEHLNKLIKKGDTFKFKQKLRKPKQHG
jgi:hypothetical protein